MAHQDDEDADLSLEAVDRKAAEIGPGVRRTLQQGLFNVLVMLKSIAPDRAVSTSQPPQQQSEPELEQQLGSEQPEQQSKPEEPAPAKHGSGPAAATTALFVATIHYEREGPCIDVERPIRDTLREIGHHAVRHHFEGCELINENNGAMRALLGAVVAALKKPPES